WREVIAAVTLDRITHRVTSRILMSRELCRREGYITTSMEFSESVFMNGLALSMIPCGLFRRLGAWICSFPHRRKLEKAVKEISPIIEQCLAEAASGRRKAENVDAIDWTIELGRSQPGESNPRRIAYQLLHNIWAGSAAPGALVTQTVFQVLMEPDRYLETLRVESRKAIADHGWSEEAVQNMPLLDSFIREVGRLYPVGSGQFPYYFPPFDNPKLS
ncbi:MAG: hypothetical protein LQ341_005951, partial [Variospora aurantia]